MKWYKKLGLIELDIAGTSLVIALVGQVPLPPVATILTVEILAHLFVLSLLMKEK